MLQETLKILALNHFFGLCGQMSLDFNRHKGSKWIFDVCPKASQHHGGPLKKNHRASATFELLKFAGCSGRGDCGGREEKEREKKKPPQIPSSLNSPNVEGKLTRAASRAAAGRFSFSSFLKQLQTVALFETSNAVGKKRGRHDRS